MGYSKFLFTLCYLVIGTASEVPDTGCEEQNHALVVLAMKVARMEEEIQEKEEIIEKKENENKLLQDKVATLDEKFEKKNEELKIRDVALQTFQHKLALLEPHIISGEWSSWSDWSSCNRTCGGGVRERRRECNDPAPACGGSSCQGEEVGA